MTLNHMPKYSAHHSHCYQNFKILQLSIKRRCTHTQWKHILMHTWLSVFLKEYWDGTLQNEKYTYYTCILHYFTYISHLPWFHFFQIQKKGLEQ